MAKVDRVENIPSEDVNKRISGESANSLSPGQQRRLKKALEEEMIVYPTQKNVYKIISVKQEGEDSEYVVSVFDTPICECMDYTIRCVGEKNKWCKHITRIWVEIKIGELPPLGIDPTIWLKSRIQDEVIDLMDEEEENAKKLRHAYNLVDKKHVTEEDYRKATMLWKKHRKNRPTDRKM